MRNLKIAVAAALVALSLGACSTLQNLGTAFDLATKSVTNPVTTDDLYKIESGVRIAFTALQTYKDACAQGAADTNCKANVAAVQQYTRQLPPLLAQLRSFVKSNDQINAITIYNQISALIANFKTAASNVGITGIA